jgi:hypothetical protein
MLKLRGVDLTTTTTESDKQQAALINNRLKLKSCPNCSEVNEATAKFCANPNCRMMLTSDEYKLASSSSSSAKKSLKRNLLCISVGWW